MKYVLIDKIFKNMCKYVKEKKKSHFIQWYETYLFLSELRNLHPIKLCIYIKIRTLVINIVY